MKDDYPVTFDVEIPEKLSRGLIFIKWLLIIPHSIILAFYGIAVGIVTFIAWWSILFTGRYPEPLFNFVVGYYRWIVRVSCYENLLTDNFPPFSNK